MICPKKTQRKKKLEHLIHQEIAQVLHHVVCTEQSESSRMTVMKVCASEDLRKVNVFLHTNSSEKFNALRQKSGKIRFILANRINMRKIPEINLLPWIDEQIV
ncbi:ribosome-binding factor A [Holospora obtusa F1]|uniref:Ribosome-binding factor A n=1 Tax=Holospora obtusa F1 TaxID=1399147 RepID=W6TTU4_HOLOB|nr:ribosome-binding factor A [Holospora obtusa]ETZ07212.1 ribosome-binding factor A [Holospora obtusa F1]